MKNLSNPPPKTKFLLSCTAFLLSLSFASHIFSQVPGGIPAPPPAPGAPPPIAPPGLPAQPQIPPPFPPADPLDPVVPVAPGPLVPGPVAPEPVDPANPQIDEGGFVGGAGLFSDPSELEGIEGLDEPMERLKVRDLDGKQAIEMLQIWTGRYILRPQNLPQIQLNFDSFTALTKRESLMAIESLLAMNGIAVTKIDGRFWKAVPALGVNAQVPLWLEGSASSVAPSQRIFIKMFPLRYAPAIEVREQLNGFATPNVSTIMVFEKANSLLVTDSLLNLQRMEKLLETIDRPISKEELGTEFFVWNTQHAGARELETKLKAMVEGSLKPFLGGTTQVDSDERTGKLVVVTRSQNLETIEFLLETLDAPVKMKTTSKLFKLQHAEAKDIQAILDEVIKNQQRIKQQVQGRKSSTPRPQASNQASKPPTPGSAAKPAAAATDSSGMEGAHEFSDFITISADERSNAILVYGTKADIEEIGTMIESLDHPLPLARIDTIFVMVDLSEDNQRGIDALFKDVEFNKDIEKRVLVQDAGDDGLPGTPDDTERWEIQKSLGTGDEIVGKLQVPGLMGSVPFQFHNWKLTGLSWGQIFAQSSSRNDVRIFSTPSLMVSHNSPEVHISIEDERTLIYPRYGGYYGSPDQQNTPQQGRDMLSAKTQLQIKKPKIGLAIHDENGTLIKPGSIFMEVEVKAEKFDETEVNVYEGQKLPAKKNREAKTYVTVRDGEIIVIGGLQEVQMDLSESRYNFLSDIPYFGKKFFRPRATKYTPTELLIFLRPTIIDPNVDETSKYISEIDTRMKSNYLPVFRSPSGRVLRQPDDDLIIREDELSETDTASPLPVFK